MGLNEFDEYEKIGEPDQLVKSKNWQAAIGLQDVDGLQPSAYLISTAKQNIQGDISFYEVNSRIASYYQTQSAQPLDQRTEEADKVSARIAEILSEESFTFSPIEYLNIHKRLFDGILDRADLGTPRRVNIKKKERVLHEASVYYAPASFISETLAYEIDEEKKRRYQGLSPEESLQQLGQFISSLWQIHPFVEGNTRTTAIFLIKYLRTLGFEINNEPFARHSKYFRNALVRANYKNHTQGIYASQAPLNKFLENLLWNKKHQLRSRDLLINAITQTHPTASSEETANNEGTPSQQSNKAARKSSEPIKTKEKILAHIQTRPTITASKMAEQLNIPVETIRSQLKRLSSKKIIGREGSKKTGHWVIKSK